MASVKSKYSGKPIKLNAEPQIEYSYEYVICPYCDERSGDCWEWVTEQKNTQTCEVCGGQYAYWAEYSATYYTEPVTPPPETNLLPDIEQEDTNASSIGQSGCC
jgi:hypothetical protein